jgi:acyl-CoA thioester hydrolase
MRHGTEGWLSATSENMSLHMDMNARRVAAFPPDIRERITGIAKAHSALARPEGVGRNVAMPSKR